VSLTPSAALAAATAAVTARGMRVTLPKSPRSWSWRSLIPLRAFLVRRHVSLTPSAALAAATAAVTARGMRVTPLKSLTKTRT